MKKYTEKYKNHSKNIIVLTGHMGSGKTSIAKALAKSLGWRFYDSDFEIERKQGISIKGIFDTKGEKYFRKLEKEIIHELFNNKFSIISLGGGSIINKTVRKLIEKKAISIFLKVDINVLLKRLKKNYKKRPLLIEANIKDIISQLNIERLKYLERADIIVENNKNINETIKIINEAIIK